MFIDTEKLEGVRLIIDEEVVHASLRDNVSLSDARYSIGLDLGYYLCTTEFDGWTIASAYTEGEMFAADSLEWDDSAAAVDYEVHTLAHRTVIAETANDAETALLCLVLDPELDLLIEPSTREACDRAISYASEAWDSIVTCARIVWVDPRKEGRRLGDQQGLPLTEFCVARTLER